MEQKIDFKYLYKAQAVFERFRMHLETDQQKAGAVQAFEFCYELSWKLMKRVLEKQGVEVGSPRSTFRKAFEERLIDNIDIWFEFLEKRNLSVHTYMDSIVEAFDDFSKELTKLLIKIEAVI